MALETLGLVMARVWLGTRIDGWVGVNSRWLCLLIPLAAACSEQTEAPEEPLAAVDLRAALASSEVSAVGVAIAPDTGARYVFDDTAGIFQIGTDGIGTRVMDAAAMPDPGVAIRYPFTDFVALGADQFAVTAIGDGFLLDLANNTMSLYFCYEPGFFPEEQEQRTDAVTFDQESNQILAQPLTLDAEGQVLASNIGRYSRETGVDLDWYELDVDFVAGGMTVDAPGSTLLGSGTKLYRYTFESRRFDLVGNLKRFGVQSIDGLAFDSSANSLLVLDNTSDQLIEIERDRL